MSTRKPPPLIPGAQPPVELAHLKQKKPYKVAAGLKAVEEVMQYGLEQAGLMNTLRTVHKLNQTDGFDCQSCAWPNPDGERSFAEFCENGFKAVTYEAATRRLTREFFEQHSVAELAQHSDHWLGHQGRLTEPMILREGATHYTPISWDETFTYLGEKLKGLKSPHEALFYTSGRTSNETAFLYQLMVRVFGTNNLPDCSNMCHESTSVALPPMIGLGKACVKLSDFDHADAIFIFGQNPGTNHPRMLTPLQAAKERGCKIVFVNPLPETGAFRFKNPQDLLHPLRMPRFFFGSGTQMSDLWLPVTINGDMAVVQGLMKGLLEAEDANPGTVFDHKFITHYTTGIDELIAQLRKVTWEEIVENSGLPLEKIREAVQIALGAKNIIVCWCMGLTQQHNAVATVQDVINFLLLRGNIGRPGAGPCPVRGHSNVQGDRTVGIWDKPKPEFLDKLKEEFGFEPPREHGFDVVEGLKAMHDGKIRVFFAMGGNMLSAPSDTEFTATAMRQCDVTAHVSIKLNRSHLITGKTALILPCLGRSELDCRNGVNQFMTVEDTMGVISSTRGNLEPASSHLLSEVQIVAGLAKSLLGPRNPIPWDDYADNYDLIRDKIEAVVPGFPSFNERIRLGTFYLPNGPRDERKFETETGKATFIAHPLTKTRPEPGQYLMTSIRSHDQFNTSIYGLDDRYRGIYNGRRVVFMNEEDMKQEGFMQGELVDITSHFEGETRVAERFMIAPYPIPRRCLAGYYPECNVLVPITSVAKESNCPVSKAIPVTLQSSADQRPLDILPDSEQEGTLKEH